MPLPEPALGCCQHHTRPTKRKDGETAAIKRTVWTADENSAKKRKAKTDPRGESKRVCAWNPGKAERWASSDCLKQRGVGGRNQDSSPLQKASDSPPVWGKTSGSSGEAKPGRSHGLPGRNKAREEDVGDVHINRKDQTPPPNSVPTAKPTPSREEEKADTKSNEEEKPPVLVSNEFTLPKSMSPTAQPVGTEF